MRLARSNVYTIQVFAPMTGLNETIIKNHTRVSSVPGQDKSANSSSADGWAAAAVVRPYVRTDY